MIIPEHAVAFKVLHHGLHSDTHFRYLDDATSNGEQVCADFDLGQPRSALKTSYKVPILFPNHTASTAFRLRQKSIDMRLAVNTVIVAAGAFEPTATSYPAAYTMKY
jgi:hypothetical protein